MNYLCDSFANAAFRPVTNLFWMSVDFKVEFHLVHSNFILWALYPLQQPILAFQPISNGVQVRINSQCTLEVVPFSSPAYKTAPAELFRVVV